MTATQILGQLAGGELVVDRFTSHLHPSVLRVLPEVLLQVEAKGRQFIVAQIDFDREIGETVCIPTGSGDEIVYAQRPKRFGLSRFVKNRKPEACRSVVVIIKTADGMPGAYVLVTAFIGEKPEHEPWDRNATPKSREFWASHAIAWGSDPVIPGTETPNCPW